MDKDKEVTELNEKLAKWAGFKHHDVRTCHHRHLYYGDGSRWIEQDFWTDDYWSFLDCSFPALPNFIESLDSCFKWLVPKLEYLKGYGRIVSLQLISCCGDTSGDYGVKIKIYPENKRLVPIQFDSNPALALCRAVEQLIDKEVKGE